MMKLGSRGKAALIAPIGLLVALLVLLVSVRLHLHSITFSKFVIFAAPVVPLLNLHTVRRLVAVTGPGAFGGFFLLVIHGLSLEDGQAHITATPDAIAYILFLVLTFLYVVPLVSFFGPFAWHCAFSTLGFRPKATAFLFAGRGAIRLLGSHVDGVALMANLQHGGRGRLFRRWAALRKAVVPFFYASTLKLEAALISHEQRGITATVGLIPASVTSNHSRGWLAIALAVGCSVAAWNT